MLDEKMLTLADVEKAMREAFAPLRDKLLPTLAGLKNTLGPLPEAGGAGRTIRDVLLATEEYAAKGQKATEDAAWDSNGRLNSLGTQVANMQTDLCNRIMNTQRKVDNLGQNVQSWGSAPTGATDGISLRSCANSGSTKTRLSTRRRRWTHLQPASWDWKAALRMLPQSSLRWKEP